MVLLDLIVRQDKYKVVVAHVDHGIRPESSDDAAFVEARAQLYGVEYITKTFELGVGASEDLARKNRYDWLLTEADRRDAMLAVAHTRDDVVGSIAINLTRGTGWRGLAVMNRSRVLRPLLSMTKRQLYDYALAHRIEWVEDETNQSDAYLRNRLRPQTMQMLDESQRELFDLRNRQVELVTAIDQEIARLSEVSSGSRYFLSMIDDTVAEELLRSQLANVLGVLPQRDRVARALLAIKTAKPDTIHDAGQGVRIVFSSNRFIVDNHL